MSPSADRLQGPLSVQDDFLVLDDPVEQKEFTQYAEVNGQRVAESVLMVQGMYCAACADTVEDALCDLHGVLKAEVHAATRRLTLRGIQHLSKSLIWPRLWDKRATVCCPCAKL